MKTKRTNYYFGGKDWKLSPVIRREIDLGNLLDESRSGDECACFAHYLHRSGTDFAIRLWIDKPLYEDRQRAYGAGEYPRYIIEIYANGRLVNSVERERASDAIDVVRTLCIDSWMTEPQRAAA